MTYSEMIDALLLAIYGDDRGMQRALTDAINNHDMGYDASSGRIQNIYDNEGDTIFSIADNDDEDGYDVHYLFDHMNSDFADEFFSYARRRKGGRSKVVIGNEVKVPFPDARRAA